MFAQLPRLLDLRAGTDDAEAAAGRLRALAERSDDAEIVGAAARAGGRVASARDRPEAAAAEFERAVTLLVAAEAPLDAAQVRVDLAHVLAPIRPDAAVAEARAALTCLDRAGAVAHADAAAALLRSLGVAGRTGPRDVGVLSERERQVLHLVGLGLSNPEIAERLRISRKTAAHHVSHVLTKLGLPNRAAAAAYASRLAAP